MAWVVALWAPGVSRLTRQFRHSAPPQYPHLFARLVLGVAVLIPVSAVWVWVAWS